MTTSSLTRTRDRHRTATAPPPHRPHASHTHFFPRQVRSLASGSFAVQPLPVHNRPATATCLPADCAPRSLAPLTLFGAHPQAERRSAEPALTTFAHPSHNVRARRSLWLTGHLAHGFLRVAVRLLVVRESFAPLSDERREASFEPPPGGRPRFAPRSHRGASLRSRLAGEGFGGAVRSRKR